MGIGLRKKKQARDAGGNAGVKLSNSSAKNSPTPGTSRSVSSSSSSSPWGPASATSPKPGATLSPLVREVASTGGMDHPLWEAATALVEAEREIASSKFLKNRLEEMLGQSDLITRGVLDRAARATVFSAPGGANSSAAVQQKEDLRAIGLRLKGLAQLCNKKPLIMPFVKKKKILREVASVKTMIVAFATTNDVATSQSSYVSNQLSPSPTICSLPLPVWCDVCIQKRASCVLSPRPRSPPFYMGADNSRTQNTFALVNA